MRRCRPKDNLRRRPRIGAWRRWKTELIRRKRNDSRVAGQRVFLGALKFRGGLESAMNMRSRCAGSLRRACKRFSGACHRLHCRAIQPARTTTVKEKEGRLCLQRHLHRGGHVEQRVGVAVVVVEDLKRHRNAGHHVREALVVAESAPADRTPTRRSGRRRVRRDLDGRDQAVRPGSQPQERFRSATPTAMVRHVGEVLPPPSPRRPEATGRKKRRTELRWSVLRHDAGGRPTRSYPGGRSARGG